MTMLEMLDKFLSKGSTMNRKELQQLHNDLVNEADDNDGKYYSFAIRTQEVQFVEGETIEHCSMVWEDGDMTDEELNGVCATSLTSRYAYSDHVADKCYPGTHTAILASLESEEGSDPGERIMINPVVLKVIS